MNATRAYHSPSTSPTMRPPTVTTTAMPLVQANYSHPSITVSLCRTYGNDLTSQTAWTATLHLPSRPNFVSLATSRFATPALTALLDRIADHRCAGCLSDAEYREAVSIVEKAIGDRANSLGRDDSQLVTFGLVWNRDGAIDDEGGLGKGRGK